MKTMMRTSLLLLAVALSQLALAVGNGSLMGQVTDPDTKQPVDGATVVLDCKGSQMAFMTNEKGYYYASNVPACNYTVHVTYQGKELTLSNIEIKSDEVRELNASLSTGLQMDDIVIDGGTAGIKLIDPFNVDVKKLDGEEIRKQPFTSISKVIEVQAGAVEMDGKVYIHGSRPEGLAYYIDGCKVMGSPNVPICGVEMMQVYTGYIPAKYGDTNAGVVAIETRNWFSE